MQQIQGNFYVLRRWHSFTPKIPSIENGPGGGYFLKWNNKGIAIDPGFDFINNMQNQGIYPGDINAIAVTHSHPDHTADLEALLMMKAERLRRLNISGKGGEPPLDLFLSIDTDDKYRRMIMDHQTDEVVNKNRPFSLPINGFVECPEYLLKIETFSTKHIKKISDTQLSPLRFGIGFIFHLYYDEKMQEKNRAISIGITGDTRYEDILVERLKKCEIVVAHLGSIDLGNILFHALLHKNNCNSNLLKQLKNTIPKARESEALQQLLGFEPSSSIHVTHILKDIFQGKSPKINSPTRGHMMFNGVFNLFLKLFSTPSTKTKIGIISEYDKSLGSLRHKIAQSMNFAMEKKGINNGVEKRILSGDIGLTIKFGGKQVCSHSANHNCVKDKCLKDNSSLLFKCNLCQQWVCLPCIREHAIKYYNEGIFYNCDIDWKPWNSPSIPFFHL